MTTVCIDEKKSFSNSMIWDLQRRFFRSQGIEAWNRSVPFFATCNPFIATSYAKIYFAFIQDWLHNHPDDEGKCFYLIELGCGHGKFAFHFVKAMLALKASRPDINWSFCYVLSDYAQLNVDFWEKHPSLQTYRELGVVDFAQVNLESMADIQLVHLNQPLSKVLSGTPLTAIANYLFDSISHDCFHIQNGKISEVLVNLQSPLTNYVNGEIQDWTKLSLHHETKLIEGQYYQDSYFEQVIRHYESTVENSYVLIPIAGFRALKQLMAISNNKFLLLTSDKGYNEEHSLQKRPFPLLNFQGTFSMMVNYHAMSLYFKALGGHFILQTPRKGIKTGLFASADIQLDTCHYAKQTAHENIELFSPADYFQLHRQIKQNVKYCDTNSLVAHLALSQWDPHIFETFSKVLAEKLKTMDSHTYIQLISNIHRLAENYYYMPGAADTLFSIAVLCQHAAHYQEALKFYQQSIDLFGETNNHRFNMALCHTTLKENNKALVLFEKCIAIDPDFSQAQEWIKHLRNNGQS